MDLQSAISSTLPAIVAAPPAMDGELIAPDAADVRVVGCPSPFAVETVERTLPAGQTLIEIVHEAVGGKIMLMRRAHVTVNGVPFKRECWHYVRPKPGSLVNVRVVPGFSGGGGRKNPLGIILSIVTIAASFAIGFLAGPALAGLAGFAQGAALFAGGPTAASFFGAIASAATPLTGRPLISATAPPR